MALDVAHGTIEWLTADAVATVYTVSGLPFQPKAIQFWWTGIASAGVDAATATPDMRRGIGFATSTSNRRCAISYDDNAAATSDAGTVACDDCVVGTLDNAAARDAELDLNSITSDGFTLIVDDQLAVGNITVHWMAWGGSDITVAVCGDFAEPAAAGDVSPAVTGFTADGLNQVVLFAGVQSSSAINTALAENGGLSFGVCTGTAAQNEWCIAGSDDHASTATDTHAIGGTGKVVAQGPRAGGTAFVTANLTAWGADLFTVTFAGTVVSGRKSIFLAMKGGRWAAGGYTINGNTLNATATVSGLPFEPKGLIIGGTMKTEEAAATGSVQDRLSLGFGTSTTSRKAQGVLNENATASSNVEVDLCAEYDSVLAFPSATGTLTASYDINAMNSDGFQIIVDTAGGVASEWQGYLAFGDAPLPAPATFPTYAPLPGGRESRV